MTGLFIYTALVWKVFVLKPANKNNRHLRVRMNVDQNKCLPRDLLNGLGWIRVKILEDVNSITGTKIGSLENIPKQIL